MPFGVEPHGEAIGDRSPLHAPDFEDEPGLHAAGIECVGSLHETDVLAARDPGAFQHIRQHFATAERVRPFIVGARDDDGQRDGNLAR